MSTDTVRIEPATPRRRAARSRASTLVDTLRFPLVVWVLHFLLTQIPASLAYRFGEIRSVERIDGVIQSRDGQLSSAFSMIRPPLDGWAHWIVEPFRNWDGTWYALVAEQSYSTNYTAASAFFPLYPWLMDLGSSLTGWSVETVGYIVSHLAFAGALIMLYKLLRIDFDDRVARWTLVALAVFPTAFFFSAIYTESLFLLLSVTCLWAARRNDWLLAALVGFLAAMTRSAGVMLLAPLAVLFIQQHGWDLRRWFPKALLGVIPPLGLVVFGWFLTTKNLAFLDWQAQQWQWNRFSATPWRTFQCAFQGCDDVTVRGFNDSRYQTDVPSVDFGWIGDLFRNPNWGYVTSTEFRYLVGQSQVLDVIVTIAAFALILIGLKKVPFYYTAWVIPPMIVPLLAPSSVFPLMSMPRFVLPLFPLFVVAVLLVRNRRVGIAMASVSAVLLVLLTMQFALWYWVA